MKKNLFSLSMNTLIIILCACLFTSCSKELPVQVLDLTDDEIYALLEADLESMETEEDVALFESVDLRSNSIPVSNASTVNGKVYLWADPQGTPKGTLIKARGEGFDVEGNEIRSRLVERIRHNGRVYGYQKITGPGYILRYKIAPASSISSPFPGLCDDHMTFEQISTQIRGEALRTATTSEDGDVSFELQVGDPFSADLQLQGQIQ